VGGVQALRQLAGERNIQVIDIHELSNIVIAQVFNAILKVCTDNKK
jgi:hypothetical protein